MRNFVNQLFRHAFSINFLGGLILGMNKIHKTFTSCGYRSNLQLFFFCFLSKFSVEVLEVKNRIYPNTLSQFNKKASNIELRRNLCSKKLMIIADSPNLGKNDLTYVEYHIMKNVKKLKVF